MKRKFLATLLSMAMVIGCLAGCGSSDSATTPAADQQETGAGTQGKKEEGEASGGGVVEIEYLNHKTETEAIAAMDEIIAKFEEQNPNIKVIQTTNPDFSTVITTRAQTNDMPDLFSCSTSNTFEQMFMEGLIMDLSGQEFLNNVKEDTLVLSEYDGKNWRLPYALSLYGIYVKTDIFQENNIKIPTSYEELLEACESLKAAGVTPFLCADQDAGVVGQRMERIMGIIDSTDDEFKAIVDGSLALEDSVVLNEYAKAQIDIAENTTPDSMGVDQESSYQNFVNGDGAMLINGTWTLATLKTYDPGIKVELIPFPNPAGGATKVPMSIDTSFCISASTASTAHPEECLKFNL